MRARARARRMRLLAAAATVIMVAGIATAFVLTQGPPHPSLACGPNPGSPACDFALALATSNATFTLSSQPGPVLLDFMGSRCTTCEQEMPHLTNVAHNYAGRGLKMVSLDVGGSLGTEDPQVLRNFMSQYGGTWDAGLDNSDTAVHYTVVSLPTIFLVGKDGKVAFRHNYVTADTLGAEIQTLL